MAEIFSGCFFTSPSRAPAAHAGICAIRPISVKLAAVETLPIRLPKPLTVTLLYCCCNMPPSMVSKLMSELMSKWLSAPQFYKWKPNTIPVRLYFTTVDIIDYFTSHRVKFSVCFADICPSDEWDKNDESYDNIKTYRRHRTCGNWFSKHAWVKSHE